MLSNSSALSIPLCPTNKTNKNLIADRESSELLQKEAIDCTISISKGSFGFIGLPKIRFEAFNAD